MNEQTLLRPARPTLEEGLVFARYVELAADGMCSFLLGSAAERVLARAFLEPGHDLSHEHVTFAERAGSIVGMVSGYTAEQHGESSSRPLVRAAGLRAIRMGFVGMLGYRFFRFLDSIPPGDFYVMALAVDASQRGAGIGSALLEHVEARARSEGCSRIALDVAVDNEAAIRLYRGRGMTDEATSPRLLFLPEARVMRMVKPLA